MAYVTPDPANEEALQALRVAIRDSRRLATTLGFGPRFLHSTGQLHKGGPNTGVFIQITCDDSHDVDISFTLTATGGTSGLQAQTIFTDANNPTLTITVNGNGSVHDAPPLVAAREFTLR